MNTITIHPAQPEDAPTIASIYNEGIQRRIATFETQLRTEADILKWFEDTHYPRLVAQIDGQVVGWITASSYRARACYAGIGEFSVYIATSAQGQGIGSHLMEAFLPACEKAGFWKLVSRIFPENVASRALCQRFGFREVGIYEKHAQLDGVWRDVVIVEKLLEGNL